MYFLILKLHKLFKRILKSINNKNFNIIIINTQYYIL